MKNNPAIGVIFLTTFLDLMGFGLIIPILPKLAYDLGAAEFFGAIAAIYALMNFFFSPFWGKLSDRKGRRPIILVSILITAVGYFIFAESSVIWILIVSRVLAGIGSANIGAAQAYISDITAPSDRAKKMALIGAAFGLGFIFGPPIGGWVKSTYSLRVLGYVAGSLSLFNFVVAYFWLPESLKIKKEKAERSNLITTLVRILKKPGINRLIIINFIYILAFSMMQVTAVLLWEQHSNLDERQIGFIFAYIGICSVFVQGFLVGRLVKAFGEQKMVVIGLILMSIGLFAMPLFKGELLVPYEFIALLLIALANGFVSPALLSLITKCSNKDEVGATAGANQSIGSLGRVFGPLIGGILYELNYISPYVAGPILLMLALYMALEFKKKFAPKLID